MRVAIVADASFARREHSLLARLEIGLADEGVQLVHAIPTGTDLDDPGGLYSTRIRYESRRLAVSLASRARRFLGALADATGWSNPEELDVIHAFGEGAWPLSLELSRRAKARVVLEVWSGHSVQRAERVVRTCIAGGQSIPILTTPSDAMAALLRERCRGAEAYVAPWGVPTAEAAPAPAGRAGATDRAVAISILASGDGGGAVLAALEGIAEVCRRREDALVFLDVERTDRAGKRWRGTRLSLWRRIRKLGLLDRLTITTDMEARREPLLQTDVLVQPEATGEHRSLTLAAMAAGMVVVARTDPLVDWLIDGKTAILVPDPAPAPWARAVTMAIDQIQAHRRSESDGSGIVRTAREHVQRLHSLSRYVRAVLAAYASHALAGTGGR
jgi:glycosyltransferase involved in cell wall biosynthesis